VIAAAVTDKDGRTVAGLTADRFEIREDGQPRSVAALATGAEPLSLVICLDSSASMSGARFAYARQAVSEFFAARLPEDEFFVIGFNDRVFPIAPGSQSIDVVQAALDKVTPVSVTALYDAITSGIDMLRMASNRRRAEVVISDGRDSMLMGTSPAQTQAAFARTSRTLQHVQDSGTLVYAIGIDAPLPGNQRPAPDKEFDANALRQVTNPTGGMTVVVRQDAGVPAAAAAIVDDLRRQYLVGFEPGRPADGRFHRVSITVHDCEGCRVRAAQGYVAGREPR
jgi:VWFA-related protein